MKNMDPAIKTLQIELSHIDRKTKEINQYCRMTFAPIEEKNMMIAGLEMQRERKLSIEEAILILEKHYETN